VAAEVVALDRLPAGVLLNGDCAYGVGTEGDYTTFGGLMKPFTTAGVAFHLTLGNHDHRANLRAGMTGVAGGKSPLESKQVSVVAGARANWFLLDSLDQTNLTPGKLGDEQRKWLADALDARKDRPALVMVHHNPQLPGPDGKVGGLTDTQELYDLLTPRKHVKALIFGHTHHWDLQQREGLHLINLPAIAYPFKAGDPTGWVDLRLTERGAALQLRALDPNHPAHGKTTELSWRPSS
jgi:3',5'-cyclic AMP phosphodiesterase CpdA